MAKKKLDELFQERFSGFEETPGEHVWKGIEQALDQKKKKALIPLWWKIGGVAAALALGFLLFNPSQGTESPEIQTTDVRPAPTDTIKTTEETFQKELPRPHEDTAISKGDGPETTNELKESTQNNSYKTATDVATTPSSASDSPALTEKTTTTPALANSSNTSREKDQGEEGGAPKTDGIIKNKLLEAAQNQGGIAGADKGRPPQDADSLSRAGNTPTKEQHIPKTPPTESGLAENTSKTQEQAKDSVPKGKKSIFDALVPSDIEEEAIASEGSNRRWSAGPSVAPVYFNAMGQGSPVHSIFVPNEKSGEVNMSIGVTVAYAISKKLSLRSGVHRVDYGYDTDDIGFSSSLTASTNGQIDNINYRATSRNLVLSSKRAESPLPNAGTTALDASAEDPARDGVMSQQFGYLEVPFELNYAILDRKFGINLIGGFSSLFLVDNTIALSSENLVMEMGEANNINNLNFSTNIGLGMNYRFNQNIQLQVEPMFKYQLNTFSTTDGTFRPFAIGVYSGLSFRF